MPDFCGSLSNIWCLLFKGCMQSYISAVSVCLAEAFDTDLMYQTLTDIAEGKVVQVPTYDFVTHSR